MLLSGFAVGISQCRGQNLANTEKVNVECSALNNICHPLQGSGDTEEETEICELESRAVQCCLLEMPWPSHSGTHSNCGHLHKMRAYQHSITNKKGDQEAPPSLGSYWQAVNGFWEGGIIFFSGITTGELPMLQQINSTNAHVSNPKPTESQKPKKTKNHEIWGGASGIGKGEERAWGMNMIKIHYY